MAILKFKPHVLQTVEITGEYTDDNGDFHKGTESWSDYCKCDVVPAGKANTITLPDGTALTYSYVVYLPKGTREFLLGERVRISLFNSGSRTEFKEFTVKGFHPYQHQCKIWL